MPIEKEWRKLIAGKIGDIPQATLWYLDDAPRTTLVIEATTQEAAEKLFTLICLTLPVKQGEEEPMMNVLAMYEEGQWTVFIFPREKHRPSCYTANDGTRLLSSPASVDLGGVFIIPVENDFRKIGAKDIAQILGEVCLAPEEFRQIRERLSWQMADTSR